MASANYGALPKTFAASVTASAARIIAVSTTGVKRANGGCIIKALSTNSAIIYIGGSDVSTSNGYPLAASGEISVPVDDPSTIYAVSASGTQELRVMYL